MTTNEKEFLLELSDMRRNIPIKLFNISCRSYRCLSKLGIKKVEQLVNYPESELIKISGFGKKCLEEVLALKQVLALNPWSFKFYLHEILFNLKDCKRLNNAGISTIEDFINCDDFFLEEIISPDTRRYVRQFLVRHRLFVENITVVD